MEVLRYMPRQLLQLAAVDVAFLADAIAADVAVVHHPAPHRGPGHSEQLGQAAQVDVLT